MADKKHHQMVDVDELARGKVHEIEKLLESPGNCKIKNLDSWLSILKQVITAADLHRTNDKNDKSEDKEAKQETGDSIYADYNDDNEQFNAVDLTEQFATNSVKWTIRVHAFKIVHRLVHMFNSKSSVLRYLTDLVRLSFVAATSPYDELKMQGFEMFRFLINNFASVEEKEFPGHSILEQYKTQVFSAIKPAFNLDAPPYITAVASQVCSLWICRGLEKNPSDLKRTYQLMLVSIDKLENQFVNQNSKLYTESELEQERVEILGAWALLYITSREHELAESIGVSNRLSEAESKQLFELVQPQIASLSDKWWEALKDYALLIMPASRLIGITHDNEHVYTREVALRLFEPTWPKLVLASTIWLCKDYCNTNNNSTENDCQLTCDNISKGVRTTSKTKYSRFICGIIMKELSRCQVHKDKEHKSLSEATLFATKSLYLMLCNNDMKSTVVEDLAIAQEFYTSLYSILIIHCRDSNRSVIRNTLDIIFKATLAKVMHKKENVHYGLARLIALLMGTMKDVELACKEQSMELDVYKTHLSIRFHNLLALIKASPLMAMEEVPLREAIVIVFQEMLRFNLDPVVSLTLSNQLHDLYQILAQEHTSYFIDNLFSEQATKVSELLAAIGAKESSIDQKALLSQLDIFLKSMRSAIIFSDGEGKKNMINLYVETLLDGAPKELDNTEQRQESADLFVDQINNLRKLYLPKLEQVLRPELNKRLELLMEFQQEVKDKKSLVTTKKAIANAKLARPQTAKIALRADFSNFYTK